MTEPLPDARGVLIAEQEKEIERLRLTDEERRAIKEAGDFFVGTRTGATLVGLLKRIG